MFWSTQYEFWNQLYLFHVLMWILMIKNILGHEMKEETFHLCRIYDFLLIREYCITWLFFVFPDGCMFFKGF